MKYVPKVVSRKVGNTVLRAQKNSPQILFVSGVVGVVAAGVMACRATLKIHDEIDMTKKQLWDLDSLDISVQEERHIKQDILLHFSIKAVKAYGPSLAVAAVSITCLSKSNSILKERNAALTAAYVGIQQFLEEYRSRVRGEVGEEKEKDLYYASKTVALVEDTDKGPKTVMGSAPTVGGPYAAIFDENNYVFQDSQEYNIKFIRLQADHLTNQLRAQGHLFLNEVYDKLNIPRTSTGQVCGWYVGDDGSDDFVEIMITPLHDFHGSLLLDFNVAGMVYDMLEKKHDTRRVK